MPKMACVTGMLGTWLSQALDDPLSPVTVFATGSGVKA